MTLKDSIFANVASLFQIAQKDKTLHNNLLIKLADIFSQGNLKSFTLAFITCLKKIFINTQDTQNCCASLALEFSSKFLISLLDTQITKNNPPSDDVIQFWNNIFDFLNENHRIADTRIRKRICQFIARLMLLMSPDAELDCQICEMITDIMKERIKDRVPIVRIQAILAVYRLQDSSDPSCPITQMLLNCIETDTAADVRKLALSKISLKHKVIVSVLIDRVDDVSEKVRKELYFVFSKLHPLYFNVEERRRLLFTGLNDDNESVKKLVKNELLPAWFKRMDNDYSKFLRMFDLIFESPKLMTKIIMSLFEVIPDLKNTETINECLDKTYAIPHDQLTCENAFYWRCFVFYSSNLVDEKEDYEWPSGQSFDAYAIGLLPDLSIFCEYMQTYQNIMNNKDEVVEKWKRKEQEFIFIQLIELCKVYYYGDEVGRKNLQTLCLNLLQSIQIQTIKPVIQLYFMLRTTLNESICGVTNEINNLLHPNTNQTLASPEMMGNCELRETSNETRRATLTPEQEKSLQFKMAKLEVRLEELNDLQEGAIKMQDFAKAELLKHDITSVREQMTLLKQSFFSKSLSVCYNESNENQNPTIEDPEDEVKVSNPLENIEPETVLRCVAILSEMLNLSVIKHLTPELRALLQDFVLCACKSDSHVIAPLATELLGSFCLRDKNLAKEYFITIFSLCGNGDICVSSLRVIFDLLTCFGPETFNITNFNDVEQTRKSIDGDDNFSSDSADDETKEENDDVISGYAFLSTLINLLDDEYIEARYTVLHGLCRLMAIGKLKSAKVLSRLIIIWFHPTSREAVDIRSCLNFFFPFFVKKCKWSLSIFEEAFIPTMEILFEAPPHNPVSEIDQKCVIKVLCDITNPNFVSEMDKPCENIHHNLAVLICKSIIEMDSVNHIAILLKGLDYLNFESIHPSTLSTVNNLLTKIIKKFKRRNYKKLILEAEKYKVKLNSMVEDRCDPIIDLQAGG